MLSRNMIILGFIGFMVSACGQPVTFSSRGILVTTTENGGIAPLGTQPGDTGNPPGDNNPGGNNPGVSPSSSPGSSPAISPPSNPNPGSSPGNSPAASPGSNPGSNPSPGVSPNSSPGNNPGPGAGGSPSSSPGVGPGGSPSSSPGNNPGPGGSPSSSPGNNPGPGSSPGSNPGNGPSCGGGHNGGGDNDGGDDDGGLGICYLGDRDDAYKFQVEPGEIDLLQEGHSMSRAVCLSKNACLLLINNFLQQKRACESDECVHWKPKEEMCEHNPNLEHLTDSELSKILANSLNNK